MRKPVGCLKKVKWVKYRRPRDLVRTFFKGMGATLDDVASIHASNSSVGFSVEQMLEGIRAQGRWAFCETKERPVVVRYWHNGQQSYEDLAFMLGHELGHVLGKPVNAPIAEELRADEYGEAASLVYSHLNDTALREIELLKAGQNAFDSTLDEAKEDAATFARERDEARAALQGKRKGRKG
jgi:hypothetical protein